MSREHPEISSEHPEPPVLPPSGWQLRKDIADINVLAARLLAERRHLEVQLDALVFPILTLPDELTVEILHYTVPSNPHPSPLTAPLLLGQICHRWRDIALKEPSLWQTISFSNHRSPELLHLWLLRSSDLPLNYSVECRDAVAADGLVDLLFEHVHRWQEMKVMFPVTSLRRMPHIRDAPMLRDLSIVDLPSSNATDPRPENTIQVTDTPLLRTATLSLTNSGAKIKFPWEQLTSFNFLASSVIGGGTFFLRRFLHLIHLTLMSTFDPSSLTSEVTLSELQTLVCTCSLGGSLLSALTAPHLRILDVQGRVSHEFPDVLKSFITRSSCTLQTLSVSMDDPFTPLLLAIPDTVTDLTLRWGAHQSNPNPLVIFTALSSATVLPALTRLCFRPTKPLEGQFPALIEMLHTRCISYPNRSALETVYVKFRVKSPKPNSSGGCWAPPPAFLAVLRPLVMLGLRFEMDVVTTTDGTGDALRMESKNHGMCFTFRIIEHSTG